MITATIDTGEKISAKNLRELHKLLCGMLMVEGPRALEAITDSGSIVHAELYEGCDFIKSSDGRIIYHN